MIRAVSGLAGLVVVLAGASAAGATFQKLADTSLIAPDKQVIFTMAQPQLAANRVIFMGATSTPSVYIFSQSTAAGSKPLAIVSNKTKVPGGVGTFTGNQTGYFSAFESPACPPPAIGATKAVFIGRDTKGNAGIYSVPLTGGPVVKLVDYNTAIPGGPVSGYTKFNNNYSFCNLSVSGETVAFDAGGGVYTVQTNGTKLTRIADGNTPATGPDFQVKGYAQPSIKGSTITYVGSTVFGPYGIFVGAPKLANARAIATTNPEFAQFTYPTLEANGIVFSAKLPNQNQGLFNVATTPGAKPVRVVDLSLKPPKGTPGTKYSDFGSNVTSGDSWTPVGSKLAVFAATTTDGTNSYAGLFSRCNLTFSKLLVQNQKLGGVEVSAVSGVNYLAPIMAGGNVTGYKGALLVGGFRYAAIYTITIPAC